MMTNDERASEMKQTVRNVSAYFSSLGTMLSSVGVWDEGSVSPGLARYIKDTGLAGLPIMGQSVALEADQGSEEGMDPHHGHHSVDGTNGEGNEEDSAEQQRNHRLQERWEVITVDSPEEFYEQLSKKGVVS